MSLVSLVVSQVSHHQVERRRNTRKKYGAAVWKTTKKRLQRQMLLLPCEKIRLKNLHFLESHLPEASGRGGKGNIPREVDLLVAEREERNFYFGIQCMIHCRQRRRREGENRK